MKKHKTYEGWKSTSPKVRMDNKHIFQYAYYATNLGWLDYGISSTHELIEIELKSTFLKGWEKVK